jgi:hypothetical protein
MGILAWAGRWREAAIGLLLAALALTWVGKAMTERQNGRLKAALTEANQTIERERAEVRARTELAQALDTARAARVERDRARISKEVQSDYQAKLDDVRRRFDALRLRAAAAAGADRGGGTAAAMPGVPGAAGGADGAAGEDRLPAHPSTELRAGDALIASQQALRLEALQAWVRRQWALESGEGAESGRAGRVH